MGDVTWEDYDKQDGQPTVVHFDLWSRSKNDRQGMKRGHIISFHMLENNKLALAEQEMTTRQQGRNASVSISAHEIFIIHW